MRTTSRTRTLAALTGLGLAVALTACSAGGGEPAPTPTTPQAEALSITDPWVKAADSGMTAAFGTLENSSDRDVRIVSATSAATSSMELHEMAPGDAGSMVMRPKEGGVVVEAGSGHELAPGGDHLMLMDVTVAIRPGDDVTVTLTAEDGSTFEFTAPARTFSGANEDYQGDDGMGDDGMGDGGMGTETEGADS